MSNRLDSEQVQHFAGPDLGLDCLQRLSADDTKVPMIKLCIYGTSRLFQCASLSSSVTHICDIKVKSKYVYISCASWPK